MSLHPEVTTTSPLGTVRVWATSATHIGAEVVDGTTVFGVAYRARLDLHYRAGAWQRGYLNDRGEVSWESQHHALYMARRDDWNAKRQAFRPAPSAAARAKLLEAFEPWLVAFADSDIGRQLIRDGAAVDIEQKRARIVAKRAELAGELAEVNRQAAEVGIAAAGVEFEPSGVRTYVNAAGTVGVTIDSDGSVSVATRETPAGAWSAPIDCEPVR